MPYLRVELVYHWLRELTAQGKKRKGRDDAH